MSAARSYDPNEIILAANERFSLTQNLATTADEARVVESAQRSVLSA